MNKTENNSTAPLDDNASATRSMISLTTRFATSELGALTGYCAALALAATGFNKLKTQLGVPALWAAFILAVPLILVFLFHTLPTLRDKWAKERLEQITGIGIPGYFSTNAKR